LDHPIVFISQFAIRAGKLEGLKLLAHQVAEQLEAEKPQTLAFLIYLDDDGARITFVHLFANPAAMDLHFRGAEERSRAASELMDPIAWEIYGRPSEAAVAAMRRTATSAGVPLTIRPEFAAGFARVAG